MAKLTKLVHPNRHFIMYDGQARDWVADFFVAKESRTGKPTLHGRHATPGKFEWEIWVGDLRASIPKPLSGAPIAALVFCVDPEGRDVAIYESKEPARSVFATSAGLPTLGRR